MRPLDEQTILITGATDGLGRHVARDLAAQGARILVHGRSPERAEATAAELGGRAEPLVADLAELAQVRRLAEQVRERTDRLDVLVSNAGIGTGDGRRETSADGHELRFAVNYLAGFLLTTELLETLRASAPARIVHVASAGQMAIDFDDVMLERGYDGVRAYCQSKLAQVMFTFELAERLDGDGGLTATALHPATYMPTKMVRHPISTIEEGAEATERLIADPALDGVTGRYFNGLSEARAEEQVYDADARRRLWELSERLTN